MSILVITTMTGTFSARAIPRCSLDRLLAAAATRPFRLCNAYLLMPINPLFAATMSRQ